MPACRQAGFRVQSSTVKKVKVFDFESNAEFIQALVLRFANTITYSNEYNL